MKKQKRNTPTKRMVIEVLQGAESALCHDDIEQVLKGQMDRVTIYRVLQGFCEDGTVHRITNLSGKSYYALCHCCSADKHEDHHLHFHCTTCEKIRCMDETVFIPNLPAGFSMTEVNCVVSGRCPSCQTALQK